MPAPSFRFTLSLAAIASACALAPTTRAQQVPNGFAMQKVVSEPFTSAPTGFAFLPDGRALLLEKDSGLVRLAAVGSTASEVIAVIPNLKFDGERGLSGVAVDPAWPERPYLYFQATHADSSIHITMYTASGDLADPASTSMELGQPFVVLQHPDRDQTHNGGTLRFGPDGYLYASIGDDGLACESQDVNSLNGKILRLDVARMPGAGSGPPPKAHVTPPDNPFMGPSENAGLVFARGLRNPFRFTVDALTNDLYIGDVGDLAWEEIDTIGYAGYAGNNYGWPELEGLVPNTCCPSCTSRPPYTDPIAVYPNPDWPLLAAVTGGPLYRRMLGAPFSFGLEYDENVFFADWAGQWIRRLVRSGDTWIAAPPAPGQIDPDNWAANLGRPVDLQSGPDGALYVLVFPGGALPRGLWRIVRTDAVDAGGIAGDGALQTRSVPNPARAGAGVTIEYGAFPSAPTRLRIFDVRGRLVRVLQAQVAGPGALWWDGRTSDGSAAAPGAYFFRIDTAASRVSGRVSLVR